MILLIQPAAIRLDTPPIVHYNAFMGYREGASGNWGKRWPGRVAWLIFLSACLVGVVVGCASPTVTPTPMARQETDLSATPAPALLRVNSIPSESRVFLNDVDRGLTPLDLTVSAGKHRLRLEKAGCAPKDLHIAVGPGQEMFISETLDDQAAPRVTLEQLPASVVADAGLKVVATAEDNVAVAELVLLVDGQPVQQVSEPSLRYNVNTLLLGPGQHELVVTARDAAGNEGRAQATFQVVAATSTALPSPAPTETPSTATATALPAATAVVQPTPRPTMTRVPVQPVSARWDEITIDTYAYEQALYIDPAGAGHPYPLLHRDQVGGPRPRTFRVLVLRNDYLELTLMPELGGRVYQARYLPTGQSLFYNNRVIKPSHWGPPDQGWWLAVGGMEFCLPVDEHGYVTAEPWEAEVSQGADGSATVTMHIVEQSRHIDARVAITLRPNEVGFHLRSTLHNASAEAQALQFWINAMLSPGSHGVQPSLRFYYPTSEVIVHSRGDTALPDAHGLMAWPVYDGRDLGQYGNWRNWLGFFAPNLSAPFTAVYDDAAQLGMVRTFPPDVAQGAKLFGFGSGFGDVGAYTDDGSQYVEMWGGLTPTFWDYTTLAANASVTWDEFWYVLSGSGGPSLATDEVALAATREGDALRVVVAAPRPFRGMLLVVQGDQELLREELAIRPDVAYGTVCGSIAWNSQEKTTVRIVDLEGRVIASYDV